MIAGGVGTDVTDAQDFVSGRHAPDSAGRLACTPAWAEAPPVRRQAPTHSSTLIRCSAAARNRRRAQEVISQCAQLGSSNPILAIHDVGAGGWQSAPELVNDAGRAGADRAPSNIEKAACRQKEI
jgi:hypothetical protein